MAPPPANWWEEPRHLNSSGPPCCAGGCGGGSRLVGHLVVAHSLHWVGAGGVRLFRRAHHQAFSPDVGVWTPMLTPSAGIPPPSLSAAASSPSTSYSHLRPPRRCRRSGLPVPRATAVPSNRSAPTSLPPEPEAPAPSPSPSPSASTSSAPFTVTAAGTYRGAEDPLVSKLRTQLGVIHPLPAPPVSRSVVGLFALFFFVGAAFDKLWTLRKRRRAERELKVNGSWPQVPTPSFSLFLEEKDLQRKESVEWVNMVLGKLWKVYRTGIENWIVGLLQPVIDNLQKPDYVNRVEIRQFYLGEEPLSVRNVERRTSRRANDLQSVSFSPMDQLAIIGSTHIKSNQNH